MPDIGVPELIIILILALVIFGPSKLPEIGAAIGRSIREFRGAMQNETCEVSKNLTGLLPAPPNNQTQ